MSRYLYTARLVPIGKPVRIPFEDGGPPELMTFTDQTFELERTAKTKPPIYPNHDRALRIGQIAMLYRHEGWWECDFVLDPDVPEDVEFEVGQPVSVGLSGLKIGSRPTFLREVSIVPRGAVEGAKITRRFALSKPKTSPPAVRATSDRAAAGEVIYGDGTTITRYGIGRVTSVGGKPLLRTRSGQAIRHEGRDYAIDQPDGSQIIYSGAEGYREALRDDALRVS